MFVLVVCATMVLATTPEPLVSTNCSDDFAWMASSSSPNTSPCETWTPETNNPTWAWTPTFYNGSWAWFMPDPTVAVSSTLQIGNASQQFAVSNLSIAFLQANWGLENKKDGWRVEVTTDPANPSPTWVEVTTLGAVMTPVYNTTMIGGVWAGLKAYSGNMTSTRVKMDLRGSTLVGSNVAFRIHFISDSSVGVSGLWLTRFEYWDALVGEPLSVTGFSDNSSIYINWDAGNDPRISYTEVWDGTTLLGTTPSLASPLQVSNLTNGVTHSVSVKNFDAYGNVSPTTPCSPSTLTPLCAGVPPMTLLLMNTGGGSWTPQTAEVPCGSGVGPVDGYFVYRSVLANGPWELIGSGNGTMTQFFDNSGAMTDTNLYFYRVLSTKAGVSEEDSPPT